MATNSFDMPGAKRNNHQAQPERVSKDLGSGSLRKFLILLYKGFLLRKRHYIVTFFEIIIPVFIASVPVIIDSESSSYYIRNNKMDDRSTGSRLSNLTTYAPFDPLKVRKDRFLTLEFVYTPPNDLTEKFINDSIELFRRSTNHKGAIISRGLGSEKDMESYTLYKQGKKDTMPFIGTVLNGFVKKLPALLDYKIRYGEKRRYFDTYSFQTQRKYRMNGPHDENDYSDTFFLPWQTAVEETFIQRKMEEHNKQFDYEVWMQQFPFPEHKKGGNDFSPKLIVCWVLCYGHLVFVLYIVKRIVEEKANGSRELLKMMGMTNTTYWTSTFMNYFIIAFINALIIAIIYKIPMKNGLIFYKHTNFMILFIFLLLFLSSLILFCMAWSIFINRALFSVLGLLIVYNLSFSSLMSQYFFIKTEDKYFGLSMGNKLGICLLPTGGLLTGFQIANMYEASAEGVHWNNMAEFSLIPDMNMSLTMIMMLVSCLLFIFIIWYFDAVWPWQPGVPKPFYFLFTKSYWFGDIPDSEKDTQLLGSENFSEFFEVEPSGTYPGVVIESLTKEFRSGLTSKFAVNEVSLKIYQGQITALLGHNGAGKTTTINILTGLYTPSSGTASINGFDILRETSKARGGFGVCPQHNVLYDTLTVEEHLRIYAAMKGVQWNQLTNEAIQVLNILKLTDKRYELAKNLSGGMKRKLSLGIAIIGGSKVLFLDEPTSGLDVEARRSVWDALLEIRRDRTVILTTHYMEEADILGDRIAIMAEGEIQCCGSPMFLKQKFGTGYHLHVVKDPNFQMQDLTSLLQKYVPEVAVENELEKEISFRLPTTSGNEFGDMFEEVENNKNVLGVISFGITVTTMEDVFLNVSNISDVKSKLQSGELNHNINEQLEDVYGDTSGAKPHPLLVNQFIALLIKRFHYAKRHWAILGAQLLLPFLFMCMFFNTLQSTEFKSVLDPLKLDINAVYGKTDGFYYQEKPELSSFADTFRTVLESNQVKVEKVSEPTHYALDYAKKNLAKYLKTFLVGGAIDKDLNGTMNLTAWFNGEPYHSMPISLLLIHTAILKSISSDGGISLINAPLPQPKDDSRGISNTIELYAKMYAAVYIPLAFSSLAAGFVLVPIHERATKAKLLQLMSGVPAVLYWISMFVFDYLVYLLICILLIIPYGIFAPHIFFGQRSEAIGVAFLMMMCFGWASIPFSYLLSFLFKKGNTGYSVVVGLCVFAGTVLGTSLSALKMAFPKSGLLSFFNWIFRFLPPFSLASGFSNLFKVAYPNAFCESIPKADIEFNCNETNVDEGNPLFKCCKELCGTNCSKPIYPITWDEENGCGREIFALTISGIIFFSILLLKETPYWTAFFRALRVRLQRMKKPAVPQFVRQESVIEDSEVLQEEERIRNMATAGYQSGEVALLVAELTKMFNNFYAVNKLSFGIRQQECFGFLGVNGAGKTTTFRMLTGDCEPMSGNAFIQNSSLLTNLKKFQSYLGYCPQFDALIDRLTGREMLMLFGQLRGLTGSGLLEMVDKLIKMTDLVKHADKQTQFYSGGNKRKLSVAIALIGSPPLILLDEPTAGVDPVSRRKIWNILSQARNNTGAAVLLTTHSMEESEALCNRLAIMVNGRFRCLGSIQQLKSKYGQGYTLIIKVKREDQENIQKVDAIKSHIQGKIQGANLKDDHQGMLQYHIVNPSITLSFLFKFMSEMKIQFELEDYLISDTSLEQIFLTFARAQRVVSS